MKFSFIIYQTFPYILLPILCTFFDETLKIPWINRSDILRALVDNSGHGSIAVLSWMAVAGLKSMNTRGIAESALCGVLACAIDLDHFIMAKSYGLKDALSLSQRPPLHSTSIVVPLIPIMTIISLYYPTLWTLPFLATVSVISHHVRDGHRRGLWFWPLGSTLPIPYWLYLVIIVLLPLTISLIARRVVGSRVNVTDSIA